VFDKFDKLQYFLIFTLNCTKPLCKFCPKRIRPKLGLVPIRSFICFNLDMPVINMLLLLMMMMMMMMMNAQTIGTDK